MDAELKHRREQFIHGNHGSNGPWEVFHLIIIAQFSHILSESFVFALPALPKTWPIVSLIIDFTMVYSPLIMAVTICHNHITLILITILVLILFNFAIYVKSNSKCISWQNIGQQSIQYPDTKRFPYLSNMMSSLLMATCLAIFAVDFPSFDRRFSKTEMYGWSLMDVGVGCFIAINGALSPESRLINSKISLIERFKKTLRSSLPLIVIGLFRLVATKSVNYQEHVTEYGIHWNFFFTISFVKILSSILCALLGEQINLYTVSIMIMIVHQIMLKTFGTEFIMDPSNRSLNLFAANKEGFISLPGFISIYLFFVQLGRNYIPKREKVNELLSIILQLVIIGLQSLAVMFAAYHLLEPVSRREANMPFICFITCCACLNIVIELVYFIWIQIAKPNFHYESSVFSVINHKGLLIFLIANLITGLVNLSIDTMMVNNVMSVLLIHLYAVVLTFSGFLLDKIFT
ncbi:hypothetical protein DERP_011777 [Dermatophagoides pteronyssinus]|uniref:Phosphatidylinositol-glycan biosynthesis class W protein n=1 Tax=Dermatophagoides pteronyssinus TaxID=6956 RepID=A0ABQ8JR09_DERPT|nr:hypothetical protein DERP_011777 [Dermatophagoides pteronyssinus]